MLVDPGVHGGHDALLALLSAQPGHLGGREVRVDRKARDRRQPVLVRGQVARDGDGPPVLPAQRRPVRLAGLPVPAEDGLALVREPDRLDRSPGRGKRGAARLEDRVEQLLWVLLDGAVGTGLGVNASVAFTEDLAVLGHDERLGRRRALVDGQDVHARANLHR